MRCARAAASDESVGCAHVLWEDPLVAASPGGVHTRVHTSVVHAVGGASPTTPNHPTPYAVCCCHKMHV